MKIRTIITLALLALFAWPAGARTIIFTVKFQAACPVTVIVNGVSYEITTADKYATSLPGAVVVNVDGNESVEWAAYDRDGRSLPGERSYVYDGGGYDKVLRYTRIIIGGNSYVRYPNHDSDSGDEPIDEVPSDYESGTSDYSESGSMKENLARTTGRAASSIIGTIFETAHTFSSYSSDCYPNFQIGAGISKAYGEFARMRLYLGGAGGITLYGGIGKDWLFDSDIKDGILWNVGAAAYVALGEDENQDITCGLSYGKTYLVEEYYNYNSRTSYREAEKVGSLNVDLDYTYFFGEDLRFGVFGGGSVGLTTDDDEDIVWDLHIGVTYKLWAND